MKINELSIEGFRGFKDKVEFKLDPQVNVFLGVNGAGKTTVLDAVGNSLAYLINRAIRQGVIYDEKKLQDINIEKEKIAIDVNISWEDIESTTISSILEKNNYNIDSRMTLSLSDKFRNKILEDKKLPLILYFNKTTKTKQPAKFTYDHRAYKLYKDSFYPKQSSFNALLDWITDETHAENQGKIKRRDFDYKNPTLELFRFFLSVFIKEIDQGQTDYKILLDYPNKENLSLNFDANKKAILYIQKGNIEFYFSSLSQGEKEIILMVSEIIRRAIFASLSSKMDDVRNIKGIILIDEIEQHLHPKWQRNIIPALTKVFPNIQWFVTTHSPQVLSNLKRENIHLIEDFKVVQGIDPTYGEDSNTILENIFGVKKRPSHAEKHFSKFYRMLEKDAESSLEVLAELEEVYGKEHLEVKKARLEYEYEYGKYSI